MPIWGASFAALVFFQKLFEAAKCATIQTFFHERIGGEEAVAGSSTQLGLLCLVFVWGLYRPNAAHADDDQKWTISNSIS
eukprot:1160514-Pelagomonas_calceolata.AAC.13